MSSFSTLKKNSKSNFKRLQITVIADYDEQVIDGMYEHALISKSTFEKELSSKASEIENDSSLNEDERYSLMDSISDESYVNQQTTDLIGEMQIIALYKTVEIAIKRMLKASDLFTEKQLESFFRISKLKKQIKNKVCDLTTLQGYGEYDELRCINNCIKHSGKVNKELSVYSGWYEGDPINEFHPTYQRLKSNVKSFVSELKNSLVAKVI
jgi:hypothetical protein